MHSDDMESKAEADPIAQLAYHAYGAVTDHKNYQGLPMPKWNDLPPKIQEAWRAATSMVWQTAIETVGGIDVFRRAAKDALIKSCAQYVPAMATGTNAADNDAGSCYSENPDKDAET